MGQISDEGALLRFHSPAHSAVLGTLAAMWKDMTPEQLQKLEALLAEIVGFEPLIKVRDIHPEVCPK